MSSENGQFFRGITTRICVSLIPWICGCGYAEYEARLAQTRTYYAYLDRIEQSLGPKWAVAGNVMDLRVPQPFIPIPPPAAVENEDEKPPADPRQPDYINLNFPGLFGAWESVFKVAKGNGVTEDLKGYIYVLSNYWELAGEHANDAGEFVNRLNLYLADTLQISLPEKPAAPETYPKTSPAYQTQFTYDVTSFKDKDINGTNYPFDVYSRKSGSVIGVVIVVLPQGIEMQQKINERIPMMLATFNLTSAPPKAGSDKVAPGQGSATPQTSGF